ncbi:MAG: putative quinol monooxygenase [Pseudonocardiaceae bacterium]
MSELQVIARYTISAGKQDEVLELLSTLAEASRNEPGNVAFVIYRQFDDDRKIVLLERYTSRDAFAAHRETLHFDDLVLKQLIPLLDSREIESYDVPD